MNLGPIVTISLTDALFLITFLKSLDINPNKKKELDLYIHKLARAVLISDNLTSLRKKTLEIFVGIDDINAMKTDCSHEFNSLTEVFGTVLWEKTDL